jgi:hypothetical protein
MSINPMRDLVHDFATNTRYIRDDTGEELHPNYYDDVYEEVKLHKREFIDTFPYPVTITKRDGSKLKYSFEHLIRYNNIRLTKY